VLGGSARTKSAHALHLRDEFGRAMGVELAAELGVE